jgi:CheY-like chemotaxis protein
VVEDEARVRKLICEVLASRGYHVVEAVRGEQAIRRAAEHRGKIDLMVVDVVMPEMSGPHVASALGSEPVTAYVVHHDAIFDPGMEVRRHMTVLALTPTRLVYSHTDEHPADEPDSRPRAETSTEAIRFNRISSVALTRVVPDPAAYVPGVTMPSEVMLTIGWNVLSHLELEPAHCGDENCEADHGYLGTITADDFSLRISQDADGEEAVRQLLGFVRALSDATAVQGG